MEGITGTTKNNRLKEGKNMGIRKSETKYRVNITIDRDLWEQLKEYSKENHTTCSAIITQWVLKYAKVKLLDR